MGDDRLDGQNLAILRMRFHGRLTTGGPNGDCWLWNEGISHYGRMRWRGRVLSAHRVAIGVATGRWGPG